MVFIRDAEDREGESEGFERRVKRWADDKGREKKRRRKASALPSTNY
jgi:hypothetical protein